MTPTDKFVKAMRLIAGDYVDRNYIRMAVEAFADEISHNTSPLIQEAARVVLLKQVMGDV